MSENIWLGSMDKEGRVALIFGFHHIYGAVTYCAIQNYDLTLLYQHNRNRSQ